MCGSGSPFTKVALRGFDLRGFDCGFLCTLSLFAFLRKCLCLVLLAENERFISLCFFFCPFISG